MVYGPLAAFLVELSPTRIRYTSMSLPFHIGNGVFGGLVPFISSLIIENSKTTQNPDDSHLAGLWYPIAVASVCLLIGSLYLSNNVNENVIVEENLYLHSINQPKTQLKECYELFGFLPALAYYYIL